MKKIKEFYLRLYLRLNQIKGLKYIVVTVLAIVFIGFVDEDSVWHHVKNTQYINHLQTEIDKYTELNRRNKAQIDMLDKDPKAIQKIARERYFMKADDEDIFVLTDDSQEYTFADADESVE
jgi:cell division protein FtsB